MLMLNPSLLLDRVESHALTVCVPPEVIASLVKGVSFSKVSTVVPVYSVFETVIRSTFPTTVVTMKLSVVAANTADVVISNMNTASSKVFFILIPIGSVSFRASFVPFSEVQPYDSNLRDLCQYQLVIFHL